MNPQPFLKLALVAIFLCAGFRGMAQGNITYFDLEGGYYMPSLDYWNEESYLAALGMEFKGGPYFGAGVGVGFTRNFSGRLSVGTWQDKTEAKGVDVGGIVRDELVQLKIVPVSFALLYEYPIQKLIPYGGVGASVNFIERTYSRNIAATGQIEEGVDAGRANSVHPLAGVMINLHPFIDVGLEAKYTIGNYSQAFIDAETDEVNVEKISFTGPIVTLKTSIRLDPRGRRRSYLSKYRGNYKVRYPAKRR